jgi:hypothetical protein
MNGELQRIFDDLDVRLKDALRRATTRAEHVRLVGIANQIEALKQALDETDETPEETSKNTVVFNPDDPMWEGYDYTEREERET